MAEFLIYTLKVGVCLAVFYLFFKLLLARETYHRLNRILILSAVVLSFLLPVCVITVEREIAVSQMTSSVSSPAAAVSETNEPVVWLMLSGYIYILGILVSLGRMGWSLFRLQKVFRQGERKELEGGMHLILLPDGISPFSWGKYIVMSREVWELAGETVLLHEQAHIRLRHTWDILLTDILGAAQWFNPAMMLLREELRSLHEYEADAEVLRSGVAPKDYQLLLIKKAVGGRWYSVANSFNHNNLKKRINMMLQKKSSGMARAKSLLVLPLLCAAVLAFAETKYVPAESKDSETSRNAVESSSDNVLILVDGKIVNSIDDIDPDTIESIEVIKDKEQMKQYGKAAEGKDGVILVTLKKDGGVTLENDSGVTLKKNGEKGDKLEVKGKVLSIRNSSTPRASSDAGNVLILVNGQPVKSLDNIDPNTIESIEVIKEKETLKKYGKAADGKDGVVVVTLKAEKK